MPRRPPSVHPSRLTPLRPMSPTANYKWWYRCSCGTEKLIYRQDVEKRNTRSCGCLNAELRAARNLKHGCSFRGKKIPEYEVWCAMKRRCSRTGGEDYELYGARGIRVCERWTDDFQVFLSDMGPRPSAKHSIDRINNDGNYEPANCRWATAKEQACNRRSRWRDRSVSP